MYLTRKRRRFFLYYRLSICIIFTEMNSIYYHIIVSFCVYIPGYPEPLMWISCELPYEINVIMKCTSLLSVVLRLTATAASAGSI